MEQDKLIDKIITLFLTHPEEVYIVKDTTPRSISFTIFQPVDNIGPTDPVISYDVYVEYNTFDVKLGIIEATYSGLGWAKSSEPIEIIIRNDDDEQRTYQRFQALYDDLVAMRANAIDKRRNEITELFLNDKLTFENSIDKLIEKARKAKKEKSITSLMEPQIMDFSRQ